LQLHFIDFPGFIGLAGWLAGWLAF